MKRTRNLIKGDCPICGKVCGELISHLKVTHGLTDEDSRLKIGKIKSFCSVCKVDMKGYQWKSEVKYCKSCTQKKPDTRESYENTCMEKYGTRSHLSAEVVRNKISDTCKEIYDSECVFGSEKIKKQIKETNYERWGSETPLGSKIIRDKIGDTNEVKYHSRNLFKSDIIKEKIAESKKNSIKDRTISAYNNLISKLGDDLVILTSLEEIINRGGFGYNNLYDWKCTRKKKDGSICNHEFESYYACGRIPRCYECYPLMKGSSWKELDLYNFIRSIYKGHMIPVDPKGKQFLFTASDGKKRKLDIYLPELKLAFEFNGNFYHSEDNEFYPKPPQYHMNRTKACLENNIKLIHIWEDDWTYKREIVESRIRNLLGFNQRIRAHKLIIDNISEKDSEVFLNENHLQGNCEGSRYRYGLYTSLGIDEETKEKIKGDLVAVATFGITRFSKKERKNGVIELYRFCTKLNINIIGGLSKIIKRFNLDTKINEFISYCSRDWGEGNGYLKSGFKKLYETGPGCWYICKEHDWIRENRFKYQKGKLKNIFLDLSEEFIRTNTEEQIMESKGYSRLWDTGNIKFNYKF